MVTVVASTWWTCCSQKLGPTPSNPFKLPTKYFEVDLGHIPTLSVELVARPFLLALRSLKLLTLNIAPHETGPLPLRQTSEITTYNPSTDVYLA